MFLSLLITPSDCLIKGSITDPCRLYTTPVSHVAENIQDGPQISVQSNTNNLLRLFSPGDGLNFLELMSQIGCCVDCGRCFGVALLQTSDPVKHLCPNDPSLHPSTRDEPSSPLVGAWIEGKEMFVEDGLLPLSASNPPGPSRPRSNRSNVRYNPIARKNSFSTPPYVHSSTIDLTVDETP